MKYITGIQELIESELVILQTYRMNELVKLQLVEQTNSSNLLLGQVRLG